MNEPNYTEILEEAKLGLLDKATILDHLEKAREILANYEKQEADVQGNLDAANFELSMAGEDAKRQREICDLYGLPAELEETLREIQEMASFYRRLINNLEAELADYKNFDKKLCLKNIRDLLKDKPEVKIGQIEKDAGVSAGYMSRLEKPDNNAEPSMEFIVTAAKMLDVTVDELIKKRVEEITPAEKYILDFFKNVIEDTYKHEFHWKKERVEYFTRPHNIYDDRWHDHPLLSYDEKTTDSDGTPFQTLFISSFYPDTEVFVKTGVYYAQIPSSSNKVFLVPCHTVDDEVMGSVDFFEVYLVNGEDQASPLCNTLQTGAAVTAAFNTLYKAAMADAAHVHIDGDVKNIIDSYMELKNLPF